MMLSELVLFRLLMVTDSRLNVQDEVCQGQAHDRCYGVCCRAVPSESMLRAREPKAVECKLRHSSRPFHLRQQSDSPATKRHLSFQSRATLSEQKASS
ncbi:uncharacterized protein LOC132405391 isoform X3 [Hypanus sabinus]|uniref:uncharacterized protein LOC132405391 isoform X3 n=1 Tax=Hypanus sabinus TaxID=79690 RepID=UPI0028C44DAA|nr:uncharacterized protein LOC132405391 isoform X3 [Hypanus sabinus]